MWLFPQTLIYIRGAGDLSSGVAYRLVKAGFPVVMSELPQPIFVRRTVSFGNAIYTGGRYQVEGVESVQVAESAAVHAALRQGHIPIVIDPDGAFITALQPAVVLDARLQKHKADTHIGQARLVIGLGPGFTAGTDCHAVIETQRGHTLGRVIWEGETLPNTGTPGLIAGYAAERVLRASAAGHVQPADGIDIGAWVEAGAPIAHLNGHPLSAPFPGLLRGLIHPDVQVWPGLKIGDLDPRRDTDFMTISDKALAIGGGVLEAILSAPTLHPLLTQGVSSSV